MAIDLSHSQLTIMNKDEKLYILYLFQYDPKNFKHTAGRINIIKLFLLPHANDRINMHKVKRPILVFFN